MSSSDSSRRGRLSSPAAAPAVSSSSSSTVLSFDASQRTLVQLKAFIASNQTAADEQKQREEEEGTAAKRNRAYFERQVRRIQQRLRRLEEDDSIKSESEEEEKAEEVKAAPVIRRSTSQRRSRRRSESPVAATTSSVQQAISNSKRRHTVAAVGDRHDNDSSSEQSGASGKKRRRSESRESGTRRPSKKLSDKHDAKRAEQLEHARMEVDADDSPLSPPRPRAAPSRPSAASPSSASSAYLDPSLLADVTPSRRAAAPIQSPRSPANVFQAEQSAAEQRRPIAPTVGTPKPPPPGRPSLSSAVPVLAIDRSPSSSTFSSLTSPSSVTGLRHRLSSFVPQLFNSQPPQPDNTWPRTPSTQSTKQQQQQQQREMSADELRRVQQQEAETAARLAAVQRQLDEERRAKDTAERERRRLAEQVQQLEREKKKEAEQKGPTRPPQAGNSQPLTNGRPSTTSAPSAAPTDDSLKRDELSALKAPTGIFARLSDACRRAIKFFVRLLSVMTLLLLALMALQTSPVRRLLGLERDTLFCPSASLPSSVDGMYHGALVRFDGKAQCTACPANGWCDEFGHLQCKPTYVRQNNLCVQDSGWLHRALYFKEQAMALLRDQAGRYECGEAKKGGLKGNELLAAMKFVPWWEALLRSTPPTEAEMDEALKKFVYAMRLIEQDTHAVNVTDKPIRDEDILDTTYTAMSGNHPLLCSLRLTAWRNKGKLLLSGLAWCGAYYLYALAQRWLRRRRARPLLKQRVIDLLQQRVPEPVAVDHVRDELWQGQDGTVWEWVEEDINADSRAQNCRVKFGEIHRDSWRWVGPVNRAADRQPAPPPTSSNINRSGSSGGQSHVGIAPPGFASSNGYAAARESRAETVFATSPAVADAMFAPPNAAFSPTDLNMPPPAAATKQSRSGCVVC